MTAFIVAGNTKDIDKMSQTVKSITATVNTLHEIYILSSYDSLAEPNIREFASSQSNCYVSLSLDEIFKLIEAELVLILPSGLLLKQIDYELLTSSIDSDNDILFSSIPSGPTADSRDVHSLIVSSNPSQSIIKLLSSPPTQNTILLKMKSVPRNDFKYILSQNMMALSDFTFFIRVFLLELLKRNCKGILIYSNNLTTVDEIQVISHQTMLLQSELLERFLDIDIISSAGQQLQILIDHFLQTFNLYCKQSSSNDIFFHRVCRFVQQRIEQLRGRIETLNHKLPLYPVNRLKPFFTVIMTVYKRPQLSINAFQSILEQSFRDFEVIIVNDGGLSHEFLKSTESNDISITYVNKPNGGLSSSRNAALKLAKGRYITYLDDDDIYHSVHLQTLFHAIMSHPMDVIYTGAEYVNEIIRSGLRESIPPHALMSNRYSFERLQVFNYIPINVISHPRQLIETIGLFDESFQSHEDWEFLIRLSRVTNFIHVRQITVQVRTRVGVSDSMLKHQWDRIKSDFITIYDLHSDLGNERIKEGRSRVLAAPHPTQARLDINWYEK